MKSATASQVYINLFSNYLEQTKAKWPNRKFNSIDFPSVSSSGCGRIPLKKLESIVLKMAETTNDSFGLEVGENIHPSDYGIFGYTMMNCATLYQAAKLVVDYGGLLNQAFSVRLSQCSGTAFFQLDDSSKTKASQILVELHLSSVVQLGRFLNSSLNSKEIFYSEVRFQHLPTAHESLYQRIFECPVKFGQRHNEIVVPESVLARPIRSASPRMLSMLLGKLKRLNDEVNNKVLLGTKVCDFIEKSIDSEGVPSASHVARHFNMSLSTLKKHLHHEQLNYSLICDEVRKKMAIRLLINSSQQLQNISDCLGFANASAFQRAFRRWTNMSPTEYRRVKLAKTDQRPKVDIERHRQLENVIS